eukprot:1150195-Pelagomonas_calceolata.AAC.7
MMFGMSHVPALESSCNCGGRNLLCMDHTRGFSGKTERAAFIDNRFYNRMYAYADEPAPIGHGQTISAPHMVSKALAKRCVSVPFQQRQRSLPKTNHCKAGNAEKRESPELVCNSA